ncbi:MAG: TIM barrel protein [Atopobiaceae bacterium]|nr:TIM barrel protein [Atopobiaceae bacterium]MEE1274070.1 sugar phosphate isomerase/epimerase family protein [Olegusella sp.]MBQ3283542.1 TIM barrel protein [Atopobiaceae bacterium]MBQ6411354.1 TIM barrel protein [Atopobiaceae bacterium]MBQ6650365.1 TIM barrel protein [Atopobiaceae bacterium]
MAHIKRSQVSAMGIHYLMYPLDYLLDGHAEAGYEVIELVGQAPHFNMDFDWNQNPEEVRKMAEDRGLRIALFTPECSCFQWKNNYADEAAHKKSMEYLKRGMDVCRRMGANMMLTNACGDTMDEAHDVIYDRAIRHFTEIAGYAQEAGVTVALEAVRPQEARTCITLDEIAGLVEAVDNPYLGAALDTVAMGVQGETPRQWFERLGDKIVHCHFVDGRPYAHLAWGEGLFPLERYINVLNEFGYEGLLSQELTDDRYYDDPKAADKANFAALSKYFVDEEA